uniref:Putative secreted protein n=1 Tax=Panstrongylus lignarius TaxID=156445 RepID=A0A224XSA4_9HEMI
MQKCDIVIILIIFSYFVSLHGFLISNFYQTGHKICCNFPYLRLVHQIVPNIFSQDSSLLPSKFCFAVTFLLKYSMANLHCRPHL